MTKINVKKNMTSEIIKPDIMLDVKKIFNIDTDITVPAFSQTSNHVPEIDNSYLFEKDTTIAI